MIRLLSIALSAPLRIRKQGSLSTQGAGKGIPTLPSRVTDSGQASPRRSNANFWLAA